jgi:hypothetical protein
MGFYLRKSFRLGPVRLNLSKHGLGVSAGITGARVGLASDGRAYFHGGREGLYVRKFAGKSSGVKAPVTQRMQGRETITVFEDTGQTFAAQRSITDLVSVRDRISREPAALQFEHLLLAAAVIAGGMSLGTEELVDRVVSAGVAGMALAFWALLLLRAHRANRANEGLGTAVQEVISGSRAPKGELFRRIEECLRNPALREVDREFSGKAGYVEALQAIVTHGEVSDAERRLLHELEQHFELASDFCSDARTEIFREAYLEAVADHELTHVEENSLESIRQGLSIPESAIQSDLEFLDVLKGVREIRDGKLPVVSPTHPLQKSEECYFESPARILKEKALRSFQQDGQRYQVRGLVTDKEGQVYITNKRVLLVHEGTSSIRIDKILDVEVDLDRSLISIVRDGSGTPTHLSTPNVMKAGAILARIVGA